MEKKQAVKREEWIDILRAMAMYWVVLGHIYNNATLYQIVNPIKMPLFYFLSGFFISLNKDFKTFIMGVLYRLILPWIVFSMTPFWIVKYAIFGDIETSISYARNFLLGYDFWFVPSFIITQILCYVIFNLLKKNELATLITSVGCFVLGLLLKDVKIFDIWAFNTALTGVVFVIMGKLYFVHRTYVTEKFISKSYIFVISLLLYIALVAISIIYFPGQTMNFHTVEYFNIIICLILIFTGFLCCLFVAPRIKPNIITKQISIMGKNTLVVYLASGFVHVVLYKVLSVIGHTVNKPGLVESVLLSLAVCIVCTVVSVISGKICPVLIGKK